MKKESKRPELKLYNHGERRGREMKLNIKFSEKEAIYGIEVKESDLLPLCGRANIDPYGLIIYASEYGYYSFDTKTGCAVYDKSFTVDEFKGDWSVEE